MRSERDIYCAYRFRRRVRSALGCRWLLFLFYLCYFAWIFLTHVNASLLDRIPALLAGPDAPPVAQHLTAKAGGLSAVLADQRDVGHVDRGFLFHDAALDIALGVRLRVPLDYLHALDDNLPILGFDDQHAPRLSPVFARENAYLVVLLNGRKSRH